MSINNNVSTLPDSSTGSSATKHSVQNMTHSGHDWLIDLTKRGVFKGQPAARTVADYYMQRTAANDMSERQFRRGYVMPNCTQPAVVQASTGLSAKTIQRANTWLHVQGIIEVSHQGRTVRLMTWDEETEAKRLTHAGTLPPPELRPGPKGRWTRDSAKQESGHHDAIGSKESGHGDAHTSQSSSSHSVKRANYLPDEEKTIRPNGLTSLESEATPGAADSYCNEFLLEKTNSGKFYFTRTDKDRKQRAGVADSMVASLTPDEARELFSRDVPYQDRAGSAWNRAASDRQRQQRAAERSRREAEQSCKKLAGNCPDIIRAWSEVAIASDSYWSDNFDSPGALCQNRLEFLERLEDDPVAVASFTRKMIGASDGDSAALVEFYDQTVADHPELADETMVEAA